MKKRILKILIPLLVIVFALVQNGGLNLFNKDITVRANGDLTITWGVPAGDPIFVVTNMLPGDMEERSVDVENNASVAKSVGVRGVKTSETGNLSSTLSIVIMEGATTLYGPVNLNQFFSDSAGPDGIPLSTLGPGDTTTYTFKVTFDEGAGNEFQDKEVIFDLIIGIAIAVPEECRHIEFTGSPIFGTEHNDHITGTNGNDLIFGFEGNDTINGNNGNDCIVGGSGNDRLHGNNGSDVILGQEGNDEIHGNNNEDLLIGGAGNDTIHGNNDNDVISGGEGNDNLMGENGMDLINGEGGNDRVDGGNNNDTLDGGIGDKDHGDGKNGTDQCSNFESKRNCEL